MLVERLMGLAQNGIDPAPDEAVDPVNSKIKVHDFFSAQSEIIRGALTVAQVKSFLNMDTVTAAEYDLIIALAPVGTTTAARLGKLDFINAIHAVFILAEKKKYPGYQTPVEVRLKLGI